MRRRRLRVRSRDFLRASTPFVQGPASLQTNLRLAKNHEEPVERCPYWACCSGCLPQVLLIYNGVVHVVELVTPRQFHDCSRSSFPMTIIANAIQQLDVYALAAAAVGAIVLGHIIPYLADPHGIRSYPGPLLAKFSDAWLGWVASNGHRSEVVHQLHKKHGMPPLYPR